MKTNEEREVAKLIGRRIKFYREAINMKQDHLSHEVGYKSGNSIISQAEDGKKLMPLDKLHKAAKVLGVPVSALLSEEPMTDEELEAFQNLAKLCKDRKSPHRAAVFSHIKAASKDHDQQ